MVRDQKRFLTQLVDSNRSITKLQVKKINGSIFLGRQSGPAQARSGVQPL
jgi:hypothetical protein